MKEKRVQELLASMNSFGKEAYHKSELLNEMLTLQSEIVDLTFNGEHASTADLRIYDVVRHLEQLNSESGNKADEDLRRFAEESKVICNLIRAEIKGNAGERKAFRFLEDIHVRKNKIFMK